MQAFGVLDRYIGKTIFTTIMMTLFMLVSLSGIIKFVDQLKKAGQGSYDALGAGMYTLLSVPKDVQIFFPMAALLGALLGLGMLAQRSELVVMQASGFTRMQVALSFIFGPLRSVPMGVRVVTGISFGFVFYVLDQIFGPLTLVYGIPPIIGALLPSASFFLISLWMLLKRS